jgi:hypothetical protein
MGNEGYGALAIIVIVIVAFLLWDSGYFGNTGLNPNPTPTPTAFSTPTPNPQSSSLLNNNSFSTYFSDLNFASNILSWNHSAALLTIPAQTAGPMIWYDFTSAQIGLLSAGTANNPDGFPTNQNLTKGTFTFQIKILPDTHTKGTIPAYLFWYGQGYAHAEDYGNVQMPLFDVYLNASTDHVYIEFTGGNQVAWGNGGFQNTYAFGTWTNDLGPASAFQNYRRFTVWLNFQNKTIDSVLLDTNVLPKPAGYVNFEPRSFYANVVYGGMFTGNLYPTQSVATTNCQIVFRDIQTYSDYITTPTS